jgi:hypothetical protein
MKTKLIGAAIALMMSSGVAYADPDADQDTTPVTVCTPKIFPTDHEGLPPSVSIPVFRPLSCS